jgi:hypothetical protein
VSEHNLPHDPFKVSYSHPCMNSSDHADVRGSPSYRMDPTLSMLAVDPRLLSRVGVGSSYIRSATVAVGGLF